MNYISNHPSNHLSISLCVVLLFRSHFMLWYQARLELLWNAISNWVCDCALANTHISFKLKWYHKQINKQTNSKQSCGQFNLFVCADSCLYVTKVKRHIDENSIMVKIYCCCYTIRFTLSHSFTPFCCTSISTYFISTLFNWDEKNAATLHRYYTWLTLIKSKLYSNLKCLWSSRRWRPLSKAIHETKNKTDPINQQ